MNTKQWKAGALLTLALMMALAGTWLVTVHQVAAKPAGPTDLFFSEYIEGGGNNKALEIYNGTGAEITFTDQYTVALYSNGAMEPSAITVLTGSVANGDVFVIAASSANQAILDEADMKLGYPAAVYFNGNDPVALFKNGQLLDVIGKIGNTTDFGKDLTAVRNPDVMQGDTSGGDTSSGDSFSFTDEWSTYPKDTFSFLGWHTINNPQVAMMKTASPNAIAPGGTVTYTVVVNNPTTTDETARLTDTLPTEVDFGAWVAQPTGATVTNDVVSWQGTLAASDALSMAFTVKHVGNPGDTVTNTAIYSGSVVLSDTATFEVGELYANLTFVYHDLENVVLPGDNVFFYISSTTFIPIKMISDTMGSVFTATLNNVQTGSGFDYRYAVSSGGEQYDQWLNSDWRHYTVASDAQIDDYRNAQIGWANLQWPPTLTTTVGTATDNVYGQIWVDTLTNLEGEGRGIKAAVGYGDDADPANWTWFPMTYNAQATNIGNNDEFMGPITPTAAGVFSYTTRFDLNWGTGNPNAAWTYTDKDGAPYSGDQAGVLTVTVPSVSIYDIQHVNDPGTSDASPYNGEQVTVEGIVYAVFSKGYFIAEAPGPWHGIYVYASTKPAIGDKVRVTGKVSEYYGLTEIGDSSFEVLSSGNPIPASTVVTAEQIPYGDKAASEQYEGVFVEVHNITVTARIDDHGIWAFTDVSSGTAKVDDWAYHAEPSVGDTYAVVRGPLVYDYSQYKIMPRTADDLIKERIVTIKKIAPENVSQGKSFTYEITVQNTTDTTLTDVVITDVMPSNATFAYAEDGGKLNGSVVSWTVASIPSLTSAQVHFVVTATGDIGSAIVNDAYSVHATNWITPSTGETVVTTIGGYTPIYLIQGNGAFSAYNGQSVKTIGVVTGFFEGNSRDYGDFNGFFLQDPNGDGDTNTSDGIFIKYATGVDPQVNVGDFITVTGQVDEFSEWDGPDCAASGNGCQTVIVINGSGDVDSNETYTLPTAISLNPPTDATAAATYWESLEGMRVTYPDTVTVVGPTSHGAIQVIDGKWPFDHVIRTGPYAGLPVGVRHYEKFGDIDGHDAPGLIVGSVVENTDGPLAYTYGNYNIITQQNDAWQVVTSKPAPTTIPSWPGAGAGEFTVGTFNTYNFSSNSDPKMGKVVSTVVQMGCPSFLAMEEIAVDKVMSTLISELDTQGCPYDYGYSHPDVGKRGVAVLWRTDQVSNVTVSTAYQSCSVDGSGSSTYDPMWDECQEQGMYPLFSRRPVVVTGTVSYNGMDVPVVVIGNHFKSMSGGAAAARRRLQQAQFVAGLVDNFVTATPDVIVLGDLNDFEDSAPLEALYASGNLTNTWYTLPLEKRYSYIHNGVSQILDHILASPAASSRFKAMSPLHLNADFPFKPYTYDPVVWRTSDHDVVVSTYALDRAALYATKSVATDGSVVPGDVVTYTINLGVGSGVSATNVVMSDTLPAAIAFGGWVKQPTSTTIVSGVISWQGDIAAGTDKSFVFTVTVKPQVSETEVVNTVTYRADNADAGSASASFTIATAPVTITKTLLTAEPIYPGDTVSYAIRLQAGAGFTAAVQMTDTLPADLAFKAWGQQNGASVNEQVISWQDDLGAGKVLTITFSTTLNPDVQTGVLPTVNTAIFTTVDGQSGKDSAQFTPQKRHQIFLPLVTRNYGNK